RIFKSFKNTRCKRLELFLGQVKCRNNFVEDDVVYKPADFLIFNCFLDGAQPAKVGNGNHSSVCAIQDANLPGSVGLQVSDKLYVKSGDICGEMIPDKRRSFNYPQMKWFCFHDDFIVITGFLANIVDDVGGKSGYNSINQGVAENIVFIYPLNKLFRELPVFRVGKDRFSELVAIFVNQFTGKKYQTAVNASAKRFETVVEQ